MTRRADYWRIEETCFNAFPSLRQVLSGSWLLRFSDGVSRRANSVNPLSTEFRDIGPTIAAAERLYRAQSLPAIFRVPSFVDPALDRELASRAYTSEGESCVLCSDIAEVAAATDPEIRLAAAPDAAWLAAMAKLQGHSLAQRATYRAIVANIVIPARFALLTRDGEPAALAFGALHAGMLCYESVIVAPEQRRQRLARRVIAALAAWAIGEDATAVCLQVQADNTPARTLYGTFGLREAYRYHYRREPPR